MTLEEQATKEALDQIYMTSKFGIGGHFVMVLIISFLLIDKISLTISILGFMTHILILAGRAYSVFEYMKIKESIAESDSINRWLGFYKTGAFLTGFAWGLIFFFLYDLSAEYHFFIYAVVIGLAAAGLLTLGVILSIYVSFMLPMLGICTVWMLLQGDTMHMLTAFVTVIGIFYYFFTARRFAQNFKQVFIEKEMSKVYVTELENEHTAFETLFEKSSDGVLIIEDGKFVQCNEKIVEMLGYSSKDELLNLHPSKLSPEFQPDGRESYEKAEEMMRLAVENGAHEFEWVHTRANDEDFFAEVVLTPITLHNHDVIHVVWRDVSEKKKADDALKAVKDRLELALLGSNDGVWDWNILDNSVYFSPRWKEMIGYSDDELPNEVASWDDRIHPDDQEETWAGVRKNVEGETEYYEGVHRLKHKDGHWVWILDRGKTQYDEDGKAVRMIGTHTDITDDKEMQFKYAQQAQMIEQIHDSVISTDLEGVITSWNTGSEVLLGYKADEMIGEHVTKIYLEEDYETLKKNIDRLKQKGEYHTEVRLVKKSKEVIFADLSLSLLNNEKGAPIGMVGYSQDITERKKAEEKLLEQKNILNHQAHHDTLTELPNRALFNDRLEQGIEKAKRNKTNLALLFIDLDHFKQINDTLGHEIGDRVLKTVTQRLKAKIRKEDTLARLGGDEFTVIMEELAKAQDASLLAKKILETLAEPIQIDDNELYVSSSIGISLHPEDGESAHNLLKYADAAMYKAKDEGRNNFQFYSAEMTERAFERVAMEASLRQALKNEEFVLRYQPQVDASTEKIIGVEALVRWQHPSMGLVSPAKFIPLAEETGLIVELDRWVMKAAMKEFSAWYKEGLKPGVLSLNLAMKQLERDDFLHIVQNSMEAIAFEPQWLELEVTEGQVMQKPEEAIVNLRQINDLGIGIAIDDFGTGYSSLSYLKRLPINKLKIDQSFVRDIPDNEEDVAIVKAIIALAKSLNLDLLGEGVETADQKAFLLDNGCESIQGYYYAQPMSAQEMKVYMQKG
ncbi:MAG: EAL domain-containing protein [Campylobacterota bacterium]|nr:EAL domain-containing protein [Campylobacterota bacterium]